MKKKILLVQGHPDASTRHFGHVLEDAYAEGAEALDHEVRRIHIAQLDFPLLRSQAEWEQGTLPPALAESQEALKWCDHLVLFFPLWLGDMPALVYRWYFRAHSVKSLERNILGFVGFAPVNETLVGSVGSIDAKEGEKWIEKLATLGGLAE